MIALFKNRPKAAPSLPLHDPLEAVPVVAPNVEVRRVRGGKLHIRKTFPPTGPVGSLIQRLLGLRKQHYVNLDERGAEFWKLVNGRRSLETIALALSAKWKREPDECRQAVVLYTRALMTRGLIVLKAGMTGKGGGTS